MMKTAIDRLRVICCLEGFSFLYLLFVAMPQKWIGGHPEAIKVPGWIHGDLFLLFCGALLLAWKPASWTIGTCAKVFIAGLLPGGPFVIEPWLRREDRRVRNSDHALPAKKTPCSARAAGCEQKRFAGAIRSRRSSVRRR